jgi:hypothetical protein
VRALQVPPGEVAAAEVGASDRAGDGRIPVAQIRPSPQLLQARSGIVLVFRVQRVASSGAIAAEEVIPVFVAYEREALGRRRLRESLGAAVAPATARARDSAAPALDRGVAQHCKRAQAQLRRVRAMEPSALAGAIRDPLVQAGLFDRRALARAAREHAARDALERQQRDWVARLERDLAIDPHAVVIPIAALVVR